MAVASGAGIIGINNRDLASFATEIEVTRRLAPMVPEGMVVVSESGISSVDDIRDLSAAGVDAFLIGEALVKERDAGGRLREFLA